MSEEEEIKEAISVILAGLAVFFLSVAAGNYFSISAGWLVAGCGCALLACYLSPSSKEEA